MASSPITEKEEDLCGRGQNKQKSSRNRNGGSAVEIKAAEDVRILVQRRAFVQYESVRKARALQGFPSCLSDLDTRLKTELAPAAPFI